MTIGVCECCEAQAYVRPHYRAGVKLDLCGICERRDIIGAWRDEFFGRAA